MALFKRNKLHLFFIFFLCFRMVYSEAITPLVTAIDIAVEEMQEVTLSDGSTASVKLLEVSSEKDSFAGAVRKARVSLEINGEKGWVESGNYSLPKTIGGVQVYCAVTSCYLGGSEGNFQKDQNIWVFLNNKDARVMIWGLGCQLIREGTFVYPIKQKLLASTTQMSNEPVYVGGGAHRREINDVYYHWGLDFGAAEALTQVVSAAEATVITSGDTVLGDYGKYWYIRPRYDVVYLLDKRGWYYRYSHLNSIEKDIIPGEKVKAGQVLGLVGKEGTAGGWSHLHFEIIAKQPSGKYGVLEAYPFVWQAYQRETALTLQAVARPHRLVELGEPVMLESYRSFSLSGPSSIVAYEWILSDGRVVKAPNIEITYDETGMYSEVLKIIDKDNTVSYDVVHILAVDENSSELIPFIDVSYFSGNSEPKAREPVTFKAKSFNVDANSFELWDFGDGSEKKQTKSSDGEYATLEHTYNEPGFYIVTVCRENKIGWRARAKLVIEVK